MCMQHHSSERNHPRLCTGQSSELFLLKYAVPVVELDLVVGHVDSLVVSVAVLTVSVWVEVVSLFSAIVDVLLLSAVAVIEVVAFSPLEMV